jgi:ankyrin repeat protein
MRVAVNHLVGLALVPVLSAAGPARAAEQDLRLVTAAAEQDGAAIRALLKSGIDVNATRADGATALLWAAHWNDLESADLLLRAGAKPNAANDYGVTPLARAAENASEAMTARLLKAGADPNLAQASGLTPLMIAAHTGRLPVVRALLDGGADVNAVTAETRVSALMWAVADQHREIASALIDAGADVHVSTSKGFTPLLFAAGIGDVEMAKQLIDAGVSVNETGSDGTHPLPFAIVSGQDAFALFLLEQGADPNASLQGVGALHAAAGSVDLWLVDWNRKHNNGGVAGMGGGGRGLPPSRRLPLIKALLARGADPNARITASAMVMTYIGYPKKGAFEPFACGTGDLRGATPLWVAAFAANGVGAGNFGAGATSAEAAQVLRTLIEGGADPHRTTADGTTPLMAAAGLGRGTFTPRQPRGLRSPGAEEAVKLLLELGADVNATNEADFTALHGAAFRGLNEVVELLAARGARIDARDFRGRTPFRLAEGSKQSFQFQDWPETADLLRKLGANVRLGIPGTVQERLRDVTAGAADQQP